MARPPKDTSIKSPQEPEEKPAAEDGNTEAEVPEAGQDSPLLDLTDAAVKRMRSTLISQASRMNGTTIAANIAPKVA